MRSPADGVRETRASGRKRWGAETGSEAMIGRSLAQRAPLTLAALTLGGLTLVGGAALAQKTGLPAVCLNPSDLGYAAGQSGAKLPAEVLKKCPKAAVTYRSAYDAGVYVRSLDRAFGGAPVPKGASKRRLAGASDGDFGRAAPADAGTRRTLRRSRCGFGVGQAAGAAGAPYPSGCGPAAGTTRGFQQGRALRRAQTEALRSNAERARINSRLLSPSLSAGERRLIQNRLRTLNQQDGLRRTRDPYLR